MVVDLRNLLQSNFNSKKVFVTGHTGFKGSWFCIWLKQLGAEVYGYALPPADAKDNLLLNILRGPGAVFLVISKES